MTLPDIPVEQYVRIKEAINKSLVEVLPKAEPIVEASSIEALNLPCSTCGHTHASHIVEGAKCVHCFIKGSEHTYSKAPDMRSLVATPGPIREAVKFTDEESALIRIQEAIYASMYDETSKSKDTAKHKAGRTYNSHSDAAHRQSVRAYQNGSSADHETAATHHELAAKAASDSATHHDEKSIHRGDYETAAKYHAAQAAAHKAAAKTLDRNNTTPYVSSYSNY